MSEPLEIRRRALALLARRDHSQQELTQKLQTKSFSPADIEPVIQELIQSRLINDHRFAEEYCFHRRKRGYGPLRIIAELQARGIAAETIAEVIQMADNAWFIAARDLWQKRFKNEPKGKQSGDFTRRAKQMRFLQYRGFTRDQIDNAINDDR